MTVHMFDCVILCPLNDVIVNEASLLCRCDKISQLFSWTFNYFDAWLFIHYQTKDTELFFFNQEMFFYLVFLTYLLIHSPNIWYAMIILRLSIRGLNNILIKHMKIFVSYNQQKKLKVIYLVIPFFRSQILLWVVMMCLLLRRHFFGGPKRPPTSILTLMSEISHLLGKMVSPSAQSFTETGALMNDEMTIWGSNLSPFYDRPDLVDWKKVEHRQVRERIEMAFHIMEKEYGVTRLLDPEGIFPDLFIKLSDQS